MTKTTVEVERTVTETEEIQICNDCGREVDEAGVTLYEKSKPIHGVEIHLCSECLNTMSDQDITPVHIKRTEEWLETKDFFDETEIYEYMKTAEIGVGISLVLIGFAAIIIVAGLHNLTIVSIIMGVVTIVLISSYTYLTNATNLGDIAMHDES